MPYKEKPCARCGVTFQPASGRQSFCSECRNRTCEHCGATFTIRDAVRDARFCSTACYLGSRWGNDDKMNAEHVCHTCGKRFTGYRRLNHAYCSHKCYAKNLTGSVKPPRSRVAKVCEWCGTAFTRCTSNFHAKHHFCCHTCSAFWWSHYGLRGIHHPSWKGGIAPAAYRTQWSRARRVAMEKSGYKCSACNRSDIKLVVHHKIGITSFKDPRKANVQTNLEVLCYKCHATRHRRDAKPL